MILDGKGDITGRETFSVFGVISEAPVTGTYTQNADCTGTMQITPAGSAMTNFNTVVVNGGKELLLIETDNNTLITGTAQEWQVLHTDDLSPKKQRGALCTLPQHRRRSLSLIFAAPQSLSS